ncbi:hypothetical protein ACIQBJ_08655 [Kitasatospora sp. NPDC088391]|uniref:hypothetical protein n=1 Tax=Kitasatospora sp. NPDC088391 TaxID=3364074 RepID=UPI0037FA4335
MLNALVPADPKRMAALAALAVAGTGLVVGTLTAGADSAEASTTAGKCLMHTAPSDRTAAAHTDLFTVAMCG